jgi:hypothetical protein
MRFNHNESAMTWVIGCISSMGRSGSKFPMCRRILSATEDGSAAVRAMIQTLRGGAWRMVQKIEGNGFRSSALNLKSATMPTICAFANQTFACLPLEKPFSCRTIDAVHILSIVGVRNWDTEDQQMDCVEARIGALQLKKILDERYAQDEENKRKHKFTHNETLSQRCRPPLEESA